MNLIKQNTILEELEKGDETFTYKEYLLQLCEQENIYHELYSSKQSSSHNTKTWPNTKELAKIYSLSKRYHSSEITTQTTIYLLHYLYLIQPSLFNEENNELLIYLCFSLSSKYNEKRIRWIDVFFKENARDFQKCICQDSCL